MRIKKVRERVEEDVEVYGMVMDAVVAEHQRDGGDGMTLEEVMGETEGDRRMMGSKYYFRSAEDILEATKPFLLELGVTVTIKEKLVKDYFEKTIPIIKTTATISDGENAIHATIIINIISIKVIVIVIIVIIVLILV